MFRAFVIIILIHVALSIIAWVLSARVINNMACSGLGEELKSNNPMIVFWKIKYADKFEKILDDNDEKIDASFRNEIILCKKRIKIVKTIQSIFFVLMSILFVLLLGG